MVKSKSEALDLDSLLTGNTCLDLITDGTKCGKVEEGAGDEEPFPSRVAKLHLLLPLLLPALHTTFEHQHRAVSTCIDLVNC
jgi:hypothetical protein